MKIKITRPTIFRKKPIEPSETPIEVSAKEAMDLIGAGKAVAVKESLFETTIKPLKEAETAVWSVPAADAAGTAPMPLDPAKESGAGAARLGAAAEAKPEDPADDGPADDRGTSGTNGKSKRKKKAGV